MASDDPDHVAMRTDTAEIDATHSARQSAVATVDQAPTDAGLGASALGESAGNQAAATALSSQGAAASGTRPSDPRRRGLSAAPPLPVSTLLQLQQLAGNQAVATLASRYQVQRACDCGGTCSSCRGGGSTASAAASLAAVQADEAKSLAGVQRQPQDDPSPSPGPAPAPGPAPSGKGSVGPKADAKVIVGEAKRLHTFHPEEAGPMLAGHVRALSAKTRTMIAVLANTVVMFAPDGSSMVDLGLSASDNLLSQGDVMYLGSLGAPDSWSVDALISYAPFDERSEQIIAAKAGIPLSKPTDTNPANYVAVFLLPEQMLHRDEGKPATKTNPANTPAQERAAHKAVEGLEERWAKRPQAATRSALVGEPRFTARLSDRLQSWVVRITIDKEHTEVVLKEGEKDEALDARVEKAIARLRQRWDVTRSDPAAPPPPPNYVPFKVHPSQVGGEAKANAPALSSHMVLRDREDDKHPVVMENATYDFAMKIAWNEGGQFGGFESWSMQYYWELLIATPDDFRAAGGDAGPAPASPPAPADASAPKKVRTEDRPTGAGQKITKKDDALDATRRTQDEVGEDTVNTYNEGDALEFGGEMVAGGFRIVKTAVVSTVMDILDRRHPDMRRIRIPSQGYYLVRCTASHDASDLDPDKHQIRAASVAVLPIKALWPENVAKSRAREGLDKQGRGAFDIYKAKLGSTRDQLAVAKRLETRMKTSRDPDLTWPDDELRLAAALEMEKKPASQHVKDLEQQLKQLEGSGHEKTVTGWHDELQAGDDGTTDYQVGATMVEEKAGTEIPLQLMLGEVKGSVEGDRKWSLYDITTPQTRDVYAGTSSEAGTKGKEQAIREALRKFAGENPYGRGIIGLAWPPSLQVGGVSLPSQLRSAPDADQRTKNRRRAYVEIAALIAPMAKVAGLAGIAEGAGAIASIGGAIDAIDKLRARARTDHLLEVGSLLDVLGVLGGIKTIGAGAAQLVKGAKLFRAAARIEGGIGLLGKVETGGQLMAIPYNVVEQLDAIDKGEGTDERKAALRLFYLAKAIKDGVVTVRSMTPHEADIFEKASKDDEPATGSKGPKPGDDTTSTPHGDTASKPHGADESHTQGDTASKPHGGDEPAKKGKGQDDEHEDGSAAKKAKATKRPPVPKTGRRLGAVGEHTLMYSKGLGLVMCSQCTDLAHRFGSELEAPGNPRFRDRIEDLERRLTEAMDGDDEARFATLDAEGVALAAEMTAFRVNRLATETGMPAAGMQQLLTRLDDDPVLARGVALAAGGDAARANNFANAVLGLYPRENALERIPTLIEAAGRFWQPGAAPVPPAVMTASRGLEPFEAANLPHFADQHTYSHFDFAGLGNPNAKGFWPAGTTMAELETHVLNACAALRAQGIVMPPEPGANFPPNTGRNVSIPGGFTVRFLWRPATVAGPTAVPTVVQFFPITGPGVAHIVGPELNAISRLLGHTP
jgi:hypothetical protein